MALTQQDIERRLGELFGADQSRVSHTMDTKSVRNPNFNAVKGPTANNPEFINVTEETWKDANGNTLTIQRFPDGTIQETGSGTAPPKPQTSQAQAAAPGGKPFIDDGPEARENGRRWGWNDQTRLYDRDLGPSPTAQEIIRNRSLPADQDPRAETDAERAARAKETIARQEREADRNKPGAPTLKPDGKGGTIAVQTMPDGSIRTTPLPGVPSDRPAPDRVTVEGTVYERDPQTGQYRPAPGIPSAAAGEPAGAPQAVDVIGRTAQNLREYSQWLNSQIELNRADPTQGLTPAQADRLLDQRIKLANAAVQEQQGVVNTQTGVYGQQITDRGQSLRDVESRRNTVQGVYNQLLGTFAPLARYAGTGGGGDLGSLILAGMDYYINKAGQVGGWRDVPSPTLGPAATAVTQAGLPGAPYTGGPAAGERLTFTEMQDPNVVRGSVDDPPPPAFLPEAQAAQEALRQQAARQSAASAPAAPAAPAPVPQATSMDASDPAQQGQPVMPPAPPVGTGAPGVTVTPVLSTPENNLPPAIAIPPTGTLPMPAAPAVQPTGAGTEAGGNVQMAPSFLNPYQQAGVNLSSPIVQNLLNDSWFSRDVIAQAMRNVMNRGGRAA